MWWYNRKVAGYWWWMYLCPKHVEHILETRTQPMWWYNRKVAGYWWWIHLCPKHVEHRRSEIKLNKLWHQVGLFFFNYHNDARSNTHKLICALPEYAKQPEIVKKKKSIGKYAYSKQPYTFSLLILNHLQNITPTQLEDTWLPDSANELAISPPVLTEARTDNTGRK